MSVHTDGAQRRFAIRHIAIAIAVQLASCALYAAGLAASAAMMGGLDLGPRLAALGAEWLGMLSLLGFAWSALNAGGLWRRRAWARRSTRIHAVICQPFCCCIPIPLYTLWVMGRPELREVFSSDAGRR
jgi:hypothetical protein